MHRNKILNKYNLLIMVIFGIFLLKPPSLSAESSKVELYLGADGFPNDYQGSARYKNSWMRVAHQQSIGAFDFGASVTLDDNFRELNADGSYISFNLEDWVLGFGSTDRHWSFSPHTSLIMSSNARPVPSVYLKKEKLTRFSSKYLSWLGSLGGEVFLGVDREGSESDSVNFFGARLEVEPFSNFKLELLRTAQFTGGSKSFGSVLLGDTNEGTSREANQMAGFGASYTRHNNRFYMQAIGEDEAGGLPSCWMYLAGFDRTAHFGGVPTTISLELVDTRIDYTENGYCGPNTAYNNGVHPYTNDGIVMGAPVDSEGRSIHLRAQHNFGVYDFDWGLGHYIVNANNSPQHRLSTQKVTGMTSYIGLNRKYEKLSIGSKISYRSFDLDKSGVERGISVSLFAERSF